MSEVTSGSLPLRSTSYWEEIGQLAATPVQAHRKTFCHRFLGMQLPLFSFQTPSNRL